MPEISLIIPTLNEAENLPLLLPKIAAALSGRDWEAIIVDDASTDQTPAVCVELVKRYPIKFLSRRYAENGLSGAVLHGMAQASGEFCGGHGCRFAASAGADPGVAGAAGEK